MSSISLPERQAVLLSLTQVLRLLYPFIIISSVLVLLRKHAELQLPTWAIFLIGIACTPVVHVSRVMYFNWQISRKAARLGATFPPVWEGKSFGSIDLLRELMHRYENEYLCEFLRSLPISLKRRADEKLEADFLWGTMKELGNTYMIYILWGRNYVTSDANVVKVARRSRLRLRQIADHSVTDSSRHRVQQLGQRCEFTAISHFCSIQANCNQVMSSTFV